MEIGKTKLALTASALAMALMLAGCGGSSSSGGVSSAAGGGGAPPPTPPMMDEDTEEQKVAAALEVGADALKAGQKAVSTATQSKKDAAKYVGMLMAIDVKGESADAVTNAQKVLDAESMLAADIETAEAEVTAAKAARADVSGDDLDTLNADIMEAEADIKAAKEDLKAVMDDADMIRVSSKAPFKNAAYHGDKAAQEIGKLIGENPTDDTAPRMAVATMQAKTTFIDDNGTGMTFSEIVGGAMMKDLADGSGNRNKQVVSIAGMKPAKVWDGTVRTDSAAPADFTNISDTGSEQGTDPNYKGIPGEVHCLGTCGLDEDGNLEGSWYFTPTSPMAKYVMKDEATTYSEEMFAYFGYWLNTDTTGATPRLELTTFAAPGGPGTNMTGLSLEPDTGEKSTSATYTGKAAGLSLTKDRKPDGSGFMNHESGHFTAEVTLTADFSGSTDGESSLVGTINKFRGDAVNTTWEVTLEETGLTAGAALVNGMGTASGGSGTDDGEWTAQGYGPVQTPATNDDAAVNHRPTGFYGNFNAHFVDGHAMGSYVTDK